MNGDFTHDAAVTSDIPPNDARRADTDQAGTVQIPSNSLPRRIDQGLLVALIALSMIGSGCGRRSAGSAPGATPEYGALDHYGVFIRSDARWIELERRAPNLTYGNVITTQNRAFNGVSSQTGPALPRGPFELLIYGQEECERVSQYEINIVDGVGDVTPPRSDIGWVMSNRRVAEIRRGPVADHPNMCRIFLAPDLRLPSQQYYLQTNLGYYFFRVEAPAAQAPPPPTTPVARPTGPIVIQPGPGEGRDIWVTSVYSYAPGGSNPGGGSDDENLKVGGWGDEYDSLIRFDLSQAPRAPTRAVLELYCYSNNNARTTPMWLERITAPWDWRTSGTGRDRDRLWWADRPSSVRWGVGPSPAPSPGAWHQIELTGLVSGWIDGSIPNHGLILKPVRTDNAFNLFHSADSVADPSLRPRLTLTY